MKWRYLPLVVVLGTAIALAWHQQVRNERLARELTTLLPLAAEVNELVRQNQARPTLSVDTNELRRLRDDKLELLRLRGEIGDLRRLGASNGLPLEQQITETRQRAIEAQQEADLMQTREDAEKLSKETQQTLYSFLFMVQQAAVRNEGVVPASWDEVRQHLGRPWRPRSNYSEERVEALRNAFLNQFEIASKGDINLATFDFLPTTRRYEPRASETSQPVLLLRERTPRPKPDGGWVRAYAFLDGQVTEATSMDGDFIRWEREAVEAKAVVDGH